MSIPVQQKVTVAAIAALLGGAAVSVSLAQADNRSLAGAAFNGAVVAAFTVVGAVVVAARPKISVGVGRCSSAAPCGPLGGGGFDLATTGSWTRPGASVAMPLFHRRVGGPLWAGTRSPYGLMAGTGRQAMRRFDEVATGRSRREGAFVRR